MAAWFTHVSLLGGKKAINQPPLGGQRKKKKSCRGGYMLAFELYYTLR
jgi:hypothetical protein